MSNKILNIHYVYSVTVLGKLPLGHPYINITTQLYVVLEYPHSDDLQLFLKQ